MCLDGSISSGYPFVPFLLNCLDTLVFNISGNLHILGFSQELLIPAVVVVVVVVVVVFFFPLSALPLAIHDIFWDLRDGTKAFCFSSVPSEQAPHG